MFGLPKVPWGPWALASGADTRPTNTQEDMASLQKLLADTKAANRTPNGRVARGFNQFSPMGPYNTEPAAPAPAPEGMDPNARVAQGFGALSPEALQGPMPSSPAGPAAAVPMPQARPPEAPQSEPMSFFQRNAAMMQDPSSGAFIDPEAAARASASGPDVIQKLLDMFHQKAS